MGRFEISIEVLDASTTAEAWWAGYGDRLIQIAHEFGLVDWNHRRFTWGVVIEVAFRKESHWDWFLTNPGVQAILDAIPDPIIGLIIQRGWGGTGGTRFPRKPRPIAGAGAAELPLPVEDDIVTDAVGRALADESGSRTRAAS